jgi:hypothetical protein
MTQHFSSDEEFWNELEKPLIIHDNKCSFKPNYCEIAFEASINVMPLGTLEKIVNNIRLAKEQELKTQSILVRKNTLREVQMDLEAVRARYEQDVSTIIRENKQLKEDCIQLRKKLLMFYEISSEQETLISCFRIQEIPSATLMDPKESVRNDSKSLKLQIKLAKEVCNIYIQKIDDLNNKVKELEDTIQDMKIYQKNLINDMTLERNKMEDQYLGKIKDLTQDFSNYIRETNVENNLQFVISKKQSESIKKLKEDLRNAQVVLTTPRLRQKTLEKYKSIMKLNTSLTTQRSTNHKSILSLPLITEKCL